MNPIEKIIILEEDEPARLIDINDIYDFVPITVHDFTSHQPTGKYALAIGGKVKFLPSNKTNDAAFLQWEKVNLMLPRNPDKSLDSSKIKNIVILHDKNGKPVMIIAELIPSGWASEDYSGELFSLIISSGIPYFSRDLYDSPSDDNDEGGSNQPKLK